MPIAQMIKKEDVDHFEIRVVSDKSGDFDLIFRSKAAEAEQLPETRILLKLFVPRGTQTAGYVDFSDTPPSRNISSDNRFAEKWHQLACIAPW
jgi:hypothetical protein